MLLGNYYDEVIKEAGLSKEAAPETDLVKEAKVAEVVDMLKEAGTTFETEEDAVAAIEKAIEDDYAEKVASVSQEFDADEISFETEEEKVAAAMEIVDGWEKTVVNG